MKTSITTILAGLAALSIASAPLAASAADWNGGHDRGGYHTQYNGRDRGGYQARGDWGHRGYGYGGGYAYAAPVYQPPYVDGYFGWAPSGFQGWYHDGGWYHHRRWNGGIWIYF